MVRKAGATDKKKGSQKNETYMAGITGAAEVLQAKGDPRGVELDRDIAMAALKPAEEVMDTPLGGLADIAAPINSR